MNFNYLPYLALHPSGAPSGGGRGGQTGQMVLGKVTKKSDGTLTVASSEPGSSSSSTVAVTTSSATTVTTTRAATAAAVKTGLCVSAQGSTDSSGNLTASSVAVSSKTDGECTATGLGGGPGRGARGGSSDGDSA